MYFAEKNGEPTKYNLMREAIDEAAAMSRNMKAFKEVLRVKGYVIREEFGRKYPTIHSVNGGQPTRMYRLGNDYTPDAIRARIRENDSRVWGRYDTFMKASKSRKPHRRVRIHGTRESAHKIKGLFALYLHYLYLLGYRPRRESYRPRSPEMRQALRDVDKYSAQVRLIAREHLKVFPDVEAYISDTKGKIDTLASERQKVYNKIRRCKDPEKMKDLKSERDGLTSRILRLRKDLKCAEGITPTVEKMVDNLCCEYNSRKPRQLERDDLSR